MQQSSSTAQTKAIPTRKKVTAASPVSETASEKAVKDAMMKTAQKIYNPSEFKMPGNKRSKKEPSSKDTSVVRDSRDFTAERSREPGAVKRSYVNLESSLSPSILS